MKITNSSEPIQAKLEENKSIVIVCDKCSLQKVHYHCECGEPVLKDKAFCKKCQHYNKCVRCWVRIYKPVSMKHSNECSACQRGGRRRRPKKVKDSEVYRRRAIEKRTRYQNAELQGFSKYLFTQDWRNKAHEKLIDIGLLGYSIYQSTSIPQVVLTVLHYIRQQFGLALEHLVDFGTKLSKIFEGVELQGDSEKIGDDIMSRAKNSRLYKCVQKILTYVTAISLHGREALHMDLDKIIKKKQDCVSYMMEVPSFIFTLVSSIKFVIERLSAFIKTGRWSTFLHSGGEYDDWCASVQNLILESKRMRVFDENVDQTEWVHSCDLALSKGREMLAFAQMAGKKSVSKDISQVLNVLQSLYGDIKANVFAQQARAAPYGLAVVGNSCIAKSAFLRACHYHNCRVRGREVTDKTMYVMDPDANFADGFKSSKTTIVMDDVGCHRDAKIMGIDPSIQNVQRAINSIAWCPDQASLEDKGKQPCLADLVMVSSNVRMLGFPLYFTSPYAAMRRLQIHITLSLKDEYKDPRDGKLMVREDEDLFPNFWHITVCRPRPLPRGHEFTLEQDVVLEEVHRFSEITDFLMFFTDEIQTHILDQQRVLASDESMRSYMACDRCFLPIGRCGCPPLDILDTTGLFEAEIQSEEVCVTCGQAGACACAEFFQGLCENCNHPLGSCNCPDPQVSGVEVPKYVISSLGAVVSRKIPFFWYNSTLPLRQQMHFVKSATVGCFSFYATLFGSWTFLMFMPIIAACFYPLYCVDFLMKRNVWLYNKLYWLRAVTQLGLMSASVSIETSLNSVKAYGKSVLEWMGCSPLLIALLALATPFIISKMISMMGYTDKKEPEMQGMMGSKPQSKGESETSWLDTGYTFSPYDIPSMSTSLKNYSFDEQVRCIQSSIIAMRTNDGMLERRTCGFALGGGFMLLQRHTIPTARSFSADLVFGTKKTCSLLNFSTQVTSTDVTSAGDELCLINVIDMTPRKKLVAWIPRIVPEFKGKAFMISRRVDGVLHIVKAGFCAFDNMESSIKGTRIGKPWKFFDLSEPTVKGDCGGLWFGVTTAGPVLLAMHIAGTIDMAFGIELSHVHDLLDKHIIIDNREHFPIPKNAKIGTLGERHAHAGTNYLENGYVESYGSLTGFRQDSRNQLINTSFVPSLEEKNINCGFAPAVLKGYQFKKNALEKIVTHTTCDPILVDVVTQQLLSEWEQLLPQEAIAELFVYDQETVLNGVAGLKYVDRINISTSAGAYFKCSKKKLLCFEDDDLSKSFTVNEEVQLRTNLLRERYERGEMGNLLFTASAKMEPRKLKKVIENDTRIFMGGPIELTIVSRQLFLAFVRIFYKNNAVFENAIGIDAHSIDWHHLAQRMQTYSNHIAGDYKGFDTTFKARIFTRIFDMIISLYKLNGATEKEVLMMKACSQDICFAMVDYFGEVVRVRGKNPSGQPLTVVANSICNSIYCRMAWVRLHPEYTEEMNVDDMRALVAQFRDNVVLTTYGDDNHSSIHDSCHWYNHTAIAKALAEFDVVYTMAEKERESVAYIPFEEVTFLKRHFRFDSETQTYQGNLDIESIVKNLYFRNKNACLSKEMHEATKIMDSYSELYFHGRQVFNHWDTLLRALVQESKLERYVDFHDYEYYQNRYKQTLPSLQCHEVDVSQTLYRRCRICFSMRYDDYDLDCFYCGLNDQCERCGKPLVRRNHAWWLCGNRTCMWSQTYQGGRPVIWSPTTRAQLQCCEIDVGTMCQQSACYDVILPQRQNSLLGYCCHSNRKVELQTQVRLIQLLVLRWIANSENDSLAELKIATTLSQGGSTESEQQVQFVDVDTGDMVRMPAANDAMYPSSIKMGELGDFLKRPCLIYSDTWTEASNPNGYTIDPWTLFLNTTSVKNKIQNYAYLRGELHIKIVVNASPFYYGAVNVNYTPLPSYVNGYANASTFTGCGSSRVPWSQKPHIWILPQTSTGGEIVLPFMYPQDYVNITSAASVASLGILGFNTFANLRSANGATSNGCTYQVYAWMENAILTGYTTGAALQGDEMVANGMISAPASALARFSRYFQNIPGIGVWAKATEIGANAISGIAKLWGWTDPPVIDDVKPVKLTPFHNLASAHISEPTSKVTLDPRAEVSVSPQIVGLSDVDELAIPKFVGHESWLCSSTWATTDAVGYLLFTSRVCPYLADAGTTNAAGTNAVQPTPMAMAGLNFAHWRGDIVYRFKIVCTKYHQGRLRITWDPVSTLTATTDYTNVAMTKIVDLAVCDEVEFRVPYQQSLSWSERTDLLTNKWSTTTYTAPILNQHNGSLTVRCLTNLSAPIDAAPVEIMVFVRGAENLEFANPTNPIHDYSLFDMQGDEEEVSEPCPGRYLVNWGESIPSLRSLLRRSTLVDILPLTTQQPNTSDVNGIARIVHMRIPPSWGYDTNGYSAAYKIAVPLDLSWCNQTFTSPFDYISSCFVAYRGSVRWTYNVECGVENFNPPTTILVTRRCRPGNGNNNQPTTYIQTRPPNKFTTSQVCGFFRQTYGLNVGASGLVLTNATNQPGVSVEMPMMTNRRFYVNKKSLSIAGTAFDDSINESYQVDIPLHPALESATGATAPYGSFYIERYFSIGTDFNLMFFLHCPTLYYNVNCCVSVY